MPRTTLKQLLDIAERSILHGDTRIHAVSHHGVLYLHHLALPEIARIRSERSEAGGTLLLVEPRGTSVAGASKADWRYSNRARWGHSVWDSRTTVLGRTRQTPHVPLDTATDTLQTEPHSIGRSLPHGSRQADQTNACRVAKLRDVFSCDVLCTSNQRRDDRGILVFAFPSSLTSIELSCHGCTKEAPLRN